MGYDPLLPHILQLYLHRGNCHLLARSMSPDPSPRVTGPLLPTTPRELTFHRPAPFPLGPIGPNVESRLRRPCKAGAQICRVASPSPSRSLGSATLQFCP